MSPPGIRQSAKPPNGLVQQQPQTFPSSNNVGVVLEKRPPRSRDGHVPDDSMDGASEIESSRPQAMSPDQGRGKSPQFSASRAMSPNGDSYMPLPALQPTIASVVGTNGLAARTGSPAPVVDRSKPPPDAFYDPASGNSPIQPGSGYSRPGSAGAGNVTADLIRDLKAKEAEVEMMKKREAWMKETLTKASRAGFVYEDADSTEAEALGLGEGVAGKEDAGSETRLRDMVVKFKQFRADVQVGYRCLHFNTETLVGLFILSCRLLSWNRRDRHLNGLWMPSG